MYGPVPEIFCLLSWNWKQCTVRKWRDYGRPGNIVYFVVVGGYVWIIACHVYSRRLHHLLEFPERFFRIFQWIPYEDDIRRNVLYKLLHKRSMMESSSYQCEIYNDLRRQNKVLFNTLGPKQNGRPFPDDIFKCIYLNENVCIVVNISLKFVPRDPINDFPALFQIRPWRRPGDKPLSESMMVSLPAHICVTRVDQALDCKLGCSKITENIMWYNIYVY